MHGFGARLLPEQFGRKMVRRTIAGACKTDLAGIGFERGNHLAHAAGLLRRAGNEHIGRLHGDGDVVEILAGVIGHVLHHMRGHHKRAQRGHQQGVAIGRRTLDGSRTDGARGSRTVFHDKGLAQLLGHAQGHRTRHCVGGAASRERHDDVHGPVGKVAGRLGGQGQGGTQRDQYLFHALSPEDAGPGSWPDPCIGSYWGPSLSIRTLSSSISAGLRSVRGARTGPASWPTSLAPALMMLTP